ncbi:MAG: hypothetical protein ACLU3Q_01045 [Bacteroides uniformis]|jgi:hypothetical protein|uniref:hypothetical protein n=1 Tax=Bacteroides uniformis TaxID=820 RepID=UPI0039B4362D
MSKAVFYVTSPLQMICAIDAQHSFHIEESMYVMITEQSSVSREQMLQIAEKYRLNYTIINNADLRNGAWRAFRCFFRSIFFSSHAFSYDYAFLGDSSEKQLTIYSIISLKRKGHFIYLDDGVATINFLNNGLPLTKRLMYFYKAIKSILSFEDRLFYTTYFEMKQSRFVLLPNTFSFFRQKMVVQKNSDRAYVIGPPTEEYCKLLGIAIHSYLHIIDKLFTYIKVNFSDNIIYIPHRRDTCKGIMDLCDKYNVIYERLSVPIELFFIESSYKPSVIFGCGSSALFTAKILYPDLQIYNIYIEEHGVTDTKQNDDIANVYQDKGILKLLDTQL